MTRLLTFLILLTPCVAMAGPPPAGTICDELKGGTPGLYGLCVAYCGAQGLSEPEAGGKQSAFSLLRAYERKRGPVDPDMPCVADGPNEPPPPLAAQCPCWNSQALMDSVPDPTSCFAGADYMSVFQEDSTGSGISAQLGFPVLITARYCSINFDVAPYDKKAFDTGLDDASVEGCRALLDYHMSVTGCGSP